MVKGALHGATKSSKLLTFTKLCRPHTEYASNVWDPTFDNRIYIIAMIQHLPLSIIL